jgi:hypothetical protein
VSVDKLTRVELGPTQKVRALVLSLKILSSSPPISSVLPRFRYLTAVTHERSLQLLIRADPVLDPAPKKKQPPQIEKKLMEEFEKVG